MSDLLCSAIDKVEGQSGGVRARVLADDLANDEQFRQRLFSAPDYAAEIKILSDELALRAGPTETLAAQGSNNWWRAVVDRTNEVVTRVNSTPAYALSRLAVETRGPINQAITTFFGDVFQYMRQKDDAPGTIRGAVLKALRAAKQEATDDAEPFIVVSHSMGGQIVFDLATNFLGNEGIRIDFWVAAASQVGLFEELKLLLASDPTIRGPLGRATFPGNVGYWWNVWDTNDILSYTGHSIFDLQVDDEEWDSGASVAGAHGAYLRRPSFYRRLAEKISGAKELNFNRP